MATNEKKEAKKDELEFSNGDVAVFQDFEAKKPKTKILKALLNIEGLSQVVTGGDVSTAKMGNLLDLFPHVVRHVRTAKGEIQPSVLYAEELDLKDGLKLYAKLSQMLSFLVR